MKLHYPESLPISAKRKEIVKALKSNQVIIVAGDTGSGKTTQLPKMCLEALEDDELLIGCTQPRRIAATSVANRVAEELGVHGNVVGYKIRFQDHTSASTKIKFMTDGVLLAETRQDRELKQYSAIIVDEAHERSLNIDFLLGYLKQLTKRRPELKIIVTSATIDTDAFSRHFDNAPIVNVSGRNYPVAVSYHPPPHEEKGEYETIIDHCVDTVTQLFTTRPEGDILIFLATERDIRECCKLLDNKFQNTTILPLFGRLPAHDQKRIFLKTKNLKIIVATNVAETSLTVPGIRYVVDSGYARISHYNARAKTTSLPVTRISRASCDQRKGRCGRVGPGICLRLYSEEDYLDRPEFTQPELKRSNLADVILQMVSLKLGDPNHFPFIDPPFKNSVREGYRLLQELGAIDKNSRLTKKGKLMSTLPIDPCIARIILEANERNCLREIKIIGSLLAIQDPRIRPAEREKEAEEAHRKFRHPHSDFISLLNIWNNFFDETGSGRSWSKLKKFCKTNFLSFQRMREWFDLHDQLDRLLSERLGFTTNESEAKYEQIHKALLPGFLRNLAKRKKGATYSGTHNKELLIFPGSGQFEKRPQWLLAAAFIETSNLYALTVANISPDWIESAAKHLCKYSWTNPHWEKKNGQVMASETVSLFGLTICSGRKVNFGKRHKKNINHARDIFIQAALVNGEMNGTYKFLQSNLDRLRKWEASEDKLRIRNILVDDLTIHTFYTDRLPAEIYDQPSLNRLLKRKRDQTFLTMKDEDILLREVSDNELVDYPTTKSVGSIDLRLEYHFDPTSDKDGVTFRIPRHSAPAVSPDYFDWLVPGLLRDKVTYLLKSLPKSTRKNFVPINESVDRIIDGLEAGRTPFLPALELTIFKIFSLQIGRNQWKRELPNYLRPRFLLFDVNGKELCSGRDLSALIKQSNTINQESTPRPKGSNQDNKILVKWDKSEFKKWGFNGLPDKIVRHTTDGEISSILYTTLQPKPEKGCVSVSFYTDPNKAKEMHHQGYLFLLGLYFKDQYRSLKKMCSTQLSGPSTLLFVQLSISRNELIEKTVEYILYFLTGPIPSDLSDQAGFEDIVEIVREKGLFKSGQLYFNQILSALRKRREVEEKIIDIFEKARKKGHHLPPKKQFFLDELAAILPVDFLFHRNPLDFHQIERLLRGLAIRVERFYVNPHKDAQKETQLQPHLNKLNELEDRSGNFSDDGLLEYSLYREMVNDYKLALFAPEVKGRRTTSDKKLNLQYQKALSKC